MLPPFLPLSLSFLLLPHFLAIIFFFVADNDKMSKVNVFKQTDQMHRSRFVLSKFFLLLFLFLEKFQKQNFTSLHIKSHMLNYCNNLIANIISILSIPINLSQSMKGSFMNRCCNDIFIIN